LSRLPLGNAREVKKKGRVSVNNLLLWVISATEEGCCNRLSTTVRPKGVVEIHSRAANGQQRHSKSRRSVTETGYLASSTPTYYNESLSIRGGTHDKSKYRAGATSTGAQPGAVTSREVRSSDLCGRIIKWFGIVTKGNPNDASRVDRFAAENGTSAEGEMGQAAQAATASGGRNLFSQRSQEALITRGTQEDRRSATCAVGEAESAAEKGSLAEALLKCITSLPCE
jgi:hypothetical protein